MRISPLRAQRKFFAHHLDESPRANSLVGSFVVRLRTVESIVNIDAAVTRSPLPQDIEFKGPLAGPPQTVVLYGDPTKPGVFVSRVKFSAGWKDPPHWHPDEVRTVMLSGTLYFGSART